MNPMYLQLAESSIDPRIPQNFTFVPSSVGGRGVWVRDDEFDDLPDDEFEELMDMLEPYQPGASGMSEQLSLFGFGKGAKAKRSARIARKQARTDLIKSKAEGIRAGTFQPGAGIGSLIGGVKDIASSIFGGAGGAEAGAGGMPPGSADPEPSKPIYKNPLFLIGGLVVVGGVLIFLSRKKKK